jgi:hypothetical protein
MGRLFRYESDEFPKTPKPQLNEIYLKPFSQSRILL